MKKWAPISLWIPIFVLFPAFALLVKFNNEESVQTFILTVIVVANVLAILSGIKHPKVRQYVELGSSDMRVRSLVRRWFYLGEIVGFALFNLYHPDMEISVEAATRCALLCLLGGFFGAQLRVMLIDIQKNNSRKK